MQSAFFALLTVLLKSVVVTGTLTVVSTVLFDAARPIVTNGARPAAAGRS
ncbi:MULTISPECIES: hypothetical protein [unclassified Frankia]|nr:MULTISPECIES: hypothetical protein [unclassified Frankia]